MLVVQILEAEKELIHDVLRFPFVQATFGVFVMNDVGEEVASGAEL